jgi:hypothetical protein
MVESMADNMGDKPEELLVDSGYISVPYLECCALAGITLYGLCEEKDYRLQTARKHGAINTPNCPKAPFDDWKRSKRISAPRRHRLRFAFDETWITLLCTICAPNVHQGVFAAGQIAGVS